LLPAYTCPDVVAAIVFAGATPRLVDFEPGTPYLDIAAIERTLSLDTAAIVAVGFLGIPERLDAIDAIARPRGVPVIYDACQAFPADEGKDSADFVVSSFGRGKPVSLLAGGSLTLDASYALDDAPTVSLPGRLRERLYNVVIRPKVFGLIAAIPALGIGETIYRPLDEVRQLDDGAEPRIAAAIERYRAAGESRCAIVSAYDEAFGETVALRPALGIAASGDALRYPLLLPSADRRDELANELAHLGVSTFYRHALPDIAGMPSEPWLSVDYTGASDFAARLLTLPVHADVGAADIEAIKKKLAD
jgi:dTDP-4-amino-4,6-dideoxygalactose transaminase